ncbi:MAG TPA: hypothetical protein VNF99_11185 [Stellaceae bacterium]|nr:hypothetical protein [Stellaceae bacterium]
MRYRALLVLLPLLGLTIASCGVQSGGLGNYNAPGTSYMYNRLNPDDFTGHGHEGGRP